MSARTIITIALVALGAACSTAATGKGETSLTNAPIHPCALGVDGAEVAVEDTPRGVALTFTAAPDKLDELRARVQHAANMYGPRKAGVGHDGQHGSGGHHGLMPMQMPPAYALAEDVDGGMKLRLFPVDEGDLAAIRGRARERAIAMWNGCR
jgi:hypothetical protein